jgi:hypothetical protein
MGTFEMWCCRRMETISWTDRVWNEEVLHRVKEEKNILHTIKRRKANWIGHILCINCLQKYVIEGKVEGGIETTERQGRRRIQLLDDLNKTRWCWKLKEEALDRTLRRTRLGRGYGPVAKQNRKWTNVRKEPFHKQRFFSLQLLMDMGAKNLLIKSVSANWW